MKLNNKLPLIFILFILVSAVTACAQVGSQSYTDPFAYCTAIGTIDAPDARFTGLALPDVIVQGYLKANNLDLSLAVDENFTKMTSWRCMDSKVYACNVGANLPCASKANLDKIPTQPMTDFCKQNPGSDFIPAVVTGRETVYNWVCDKEVPLAKEQLSQADTAGFIANIWYEVKK